MTKIIELAHALGEEIAKSDEIRALEAAKDAFQADEPLQKMMAEYDAERRALGAEFAKNADESDKDVIENLKKRLEELSAEIVKNENYAAFAAAQQAMDALMADVNAEIKFCITGERPSTCTHDCSTCAGCH
jgi:cell fate (sporulation/competence/biofilm development) regulator YlbF (YheA/YmcA/DUF963 family)